MADFASGPIVGSDIIAFQPADPAYDRVAPGTGVGDSIADDRISHIEFYQGNGRPNFVNNNSFVAKFDDMAFPDWYENFHVIPRSFDFGNILSQQTSTIEVHSAYRRDNQTWSSFTNNAGAGTDVTGFPSLPATMYPLKSYTGDLVVGTSGAPSVDDTLAFVFNFGGAEISIPIKLNRIVLFPVRPEVPYTEKLQFLTDIISSATGNEQRVALRKNPRQLFEWNVRLDNGDWERQRMGVLMYDWQQRTWGIPMWHEATQLTVAASAGDTTINVGSTDDADYRVGGLAMVFTDGKTFDVQTIASVTSTTITFENPLLGSYPVRTEVAPLRAGFMKSQVNARRYRSADMELSVRFTVTDNDSNLGDLTGLNTYRSKVLLDDCNVMTSNTISDSFKKDIIVLDNLTGTISQESPFEYGKRSSSLTLWANSRADVWNWRQFLHAMKGRQVSFFVPTYNKDLTVVQDRVIADTDLVIENIGYVQFNDRKPNKKHIQIVLKDGTKLEREIISSAETSTTLETLTLNTTFGIDFLASDVERVSFLEEVRYNSDEIVINHERGERTVHVSAPILTVFDDS